MKKKLIPITLLSVLVLPAQAAITVSVQVGQLMNSSSTIVSDSSIWAIIYDADNDGNLPGGLTYDSHLTVGNAAAILADFKDKSIVTNGTIGLDKILWAGEVDSENTSGTPGIAGHDLLDGNPITPTPGTFAELGVAANGNWAIYWFPGLTTANSTLPSTNFEVGGIQSVDPMDGDTGMVFPDFDTTGFTFYTSMYDFETNGGSVPQASLTAVAVPEASSLALSALGLGALLRRRRK